jgi:hypothetical protein
MGDLVDINIRDVEPDFKRDVNMAATAAHMSQKDWCVAVLSLEAKRALGHLEDEVRAIARRASVQVEIGQREPMRECDSCGEPCIEWGAAQRHCTKCARNWPR